VSAVATDEISDRYLKKAIAEINALGSWWAELPPY
jgi:hypothetical protein